MKFITFSRLFPATHPRLGEPTKFPQKILLSLLDIGNISISKTAECAASIGAIEMCSVDNVRTCELEPKHHTIRAGKRWKVGEFFSPRIWSGRPYASKQIEFAPPIEIKKIWDFEVDENGVPSIGGVGYLSENQEILLAKNDGLSYEDYGEWLIRPYFRKGKSFSGQIICWNNQIEYK